ncbi:9-cis-epoxycarotenoid dioxygenase NCED9, chloroplastic [Frankliniella fusca]|uniref:9-cis-epoxycarotenoid dioxygenase NCED9, chloroplastic n=1 Tax=Frankliniella fusca TaxID=407009 RepID=A0AAE1H531_9NEOP|nr:9-cis-epoxycarotenoid dioxygenase NCED9, chloroplastic [Frankliniella fusca]
MARLEILGLRCGGPLTGHLGIHWLSLFNTRTCSKITSGFNVQDVSGVTLDNNGGAKKNIRNKKMVSQDAFWILLSSSGWFNASVAQLPGP